MLPEYISTTSHLPKTAAALKKKKQHNDSKVPKNSPKTFKKKKFRKSSKGLVFQGTVAVPSALRKRTLCWLGPTSEGKRVQISHPLVWRDIFFPKFEVEPFFTRKGDIIYIYMYIYILYIYIYIHIKTDIL